jgi:hypothetical protein
MREKDVPQDKGFLIEGKVRDLCYAVDENGHYTTVLSVGWDPKNRAMSQAWDEVNERTEDVRQQVLQGSLSPIAYYMHKNLMDTKILSQYTGFGRWRVKRHMNPSVFTSLDRRKLIQYAEVFNISVEELVDIGRLKKQEGKAHGS